MPTSDDDRDALPPAELPRLPKDELMRQLASYRIGYRGTCPAPRRGGRTCGQPLVGYETKEYCSAYCRLAAKRAREKRADPSIPRANPRRIPAPNRAPGRRPG